MKLKINNTLIDTDLATQEWKEQSYWDGRNHISSNTNSQWEHEKLYLSAKGRYYLVHTSQWQGTHPWANFVAPVEAAKWLLFNEHELPKELEEFQEEVSE